jgi:hypothetical protein
MQWYQACALLLCAAALVSSLGYAAQQGLFFDSSIDYESDEFKQATFDALQVHINSSYSLLAKYSTMFMVQVNQVYCMARGNDSALLYYNANETKVEQFCLGNLTSGTLHMEQLRHNYSLSIPDGVGVIESVNGTRRCFVNENTHNGSPFTISVDSVVEGYYMAQDRYGIYVDSWTSTNASGVIANTLSNGNHVIIGSSISDVFSVTNIMLPQSNQVIEIKGTLSLATNANCHIIWVASQYNVTITGTGKLDGNRINQGGGTYRGVYFQSSHDCKISDLTIEDVGHISLQVSNGDNINAYGLTIIGSLYGTSPVNSYGGITYYETANSTIHNNILQDCSIASSGDNNFITNNRISSGAHGLAYLGSNTFFTGNYLMGGSDDGVDIRGNNNKVSNNYFYDITDKAVTISNYDNNDALSNSVSMNTFINCGAAIEFQLDAGKTGSVANNSFVGNDLIGCTTLYSITGLATAIVKNNIWNGTYYTTETTP